jgi:hypothetical protein
MRRLFIALVLPLSLLLVAPGFPAQAASVGFTDPTGDGAAGPRLDITDGVLRNRDHRILVETSYAQVGRGDLIVFLQARGLQGFLRIVSRHRPAGQDENFVLGRTGKRKDCPDIRVRWDAGLDTSRVSIPSSCFNAGNYGALRTFLLTEVDGGSDADMAPDRRSQAEWVSRG